MKLFGPDSPCLLAEGAAYLSNSRTLVVADLHLGKSAAFRARGLPVPEGDNQRDLDRLGDLIERHSAARLIIAGDLFHAPSGISSELEGALENFRSRHPISIELVLGNHDAKLRELPANLHAVPYLDVGPLRIIHDPADASPGFLHLAGHLHPVVRIPDGKRTALRLPCFLWRKNTLILPSFGSFTGGAIIKPEPNDRIFVAHLGAVIELPAALAG